MIIINGKDEPLNTVAKEVTEIDGHIHSYSRWFETAAAPSGETHVADSMGTGGGAFQLDAGNDDWGVWIQVLGSSDTPVQTGMTKYDLHEILVEGTERSETYIVQLGFGASGAAALSAEDYTEIGFHAVSNQIDAGPVFIQDKRKDNGTKAWMRTKCPGQNTATIDFYIGIHEYEE